MYGSKTKTFLNGMIKKMWWLPVIIIIIYKIDLNTAEKNFTLDKARNSLIKDMLNNYNPSVRPGQHNETLMVFVNIELQHFDFRERDGAFQLLCLMSSEWRDPKLVWSPHSYANLSHITVSRKLIWIPDLEIYDNAPDKYIRMHRNGFVSIRNDGLVFWSDSIEIHLFCTAHMKNWPHDKHNCTLYLGSWTFHGLEVDIMHNNTSHIFNPSDMKNMEYKITKFNASHVVTTYSGTKEPYVTIKYNIKFERESSYVVIFRIPALCIILFTLMALRIDPIRTEKLCLNSLSLIIASWNLIHFAFNIGHFTREVPYIVIFFSTSLVLVTLSQLLGIFSLFATRARFKGHLPYFIEVILYSNWTLHLVPIELKNDGHEDLSEQFEEVKLDDTFNLINRNVSSNDWLRFAKLLNSLAFILYAVIFLILTSVCFV